jgi:hypothetical protein
MATTALDDALGVFAATAPEFGPHGLSNHGPMAVEVLAELGRPDLIADWTAEYAKALSPAPAPAPRGLSEADWPDALGDHDRFPEWLTLFETEMADRPPRAVVGEWVPRLLPGVMASATHGMIRTAHGLRALSRADTPARRLEVAIGLAVWASRYMELPGPPLLIGHQEVPEALADLPYLPEDTPESLLITDQVAHVADIADEFEQAVASLGSNRGAVALLDSLAVGGARAYMRNAEDGHFIALLHTVTAPLALELILPWVDEADHDAALAYGWQAVAALHVAYAIERHPLSGEDDRSVAADSIIDISLSGADPHALKLAEAAWRCYGRTQEPVLLAAAADAARRLGA